MLVNFIIIWFINDVYYLNHLQVIHLSEQIFNWVTTTPYGPTLTRSVQLMLRNANQGYGYLIRTVTQEHPYRHMHTAMDTHHAVSIDNCKNIIYFLITNVPEKVVL